VAESTVTELLRQVSMGRQGAADDLFPLVYAELRRMAQNRLKGERPGHTLNATALVHEAYLRLGLEQIPWQDRVHFFAVAARAMRRVLIDHAKARRAGKRGGGAAHVALDDTLAAPERRVDDLLAIDEALNRLEQMDPRQVTVVECHVFAGMSLDDTAAALGVSPATVSRDWALARAWLNRALNPDERPGGEGAAS
jgi:RNA polymerase sigma factor (TIGR02999 family)